MSNIVLFNSNNAAIELQNKEKTLASGVTKVTYLSRKEYGLANGGIKGQALKRAHDQYRMDRGVVANGNLSQLLATGQVVAETLTPKKDGTGFNVAFTHARELVTGADPMTAAKALSDEQLLKLATERGLTLN